MVQSLESYVAQATKAYQPSQKAIQDQIGALAGQLETANQQINKNYAQQQSTLNRNRNMAAETASMQAAGSGGSFGGAANIANRKYYEQSFVPAQTQLQTNQANALAQAKQDNENQRVNLNTQLANLQAEGNRSALAQYYSDLAAEQQRQFEAEQAEKNRQASIRSAQIAADSVSKYYDNGAAQNNKSNKSNVDFLSWVQNYSGLNNNTKNYLVNNISKILNMNSRGGKVFGNSGYLIQNALSQTLGNSDIYKKYLNWRNS